MPNLNSTKFISIQGIIMSWEEAKLFFKFLAGGIGVVSGIIALWVTLDLPQAASKDYVDKKVILVADVSRQLQASLSNTRLQINRMTRQGLEAEKYRLTTESKTSNSYDIQKRIQDIEEELKDTARERDILLNAR
jgi:hypothetical protein